LSTQSTGSTLKQHKIPFALPTIGEEEIQAVVETLRSGWLTTGPRVKQFEAQFAERIGARHAIAVSSATTALELALEAMGVSAGDEVLVPTMTFASTGETVVHLGAKPVLVDCRADTLNVDPEKIEERITPRTKAIIPVHYGGQPCEMDRILAIARKHGLKVIEDAAHALPARYGDQVVGTIGDVTCFSFYATKTITTGEGGMITTDDDRLAERMRIMSLHGISKDAWKRFSAEGSWYYEILGPGYKFNMTDMAASLGLCQLRRCDEFWERRHRCVEQYDKGFADVSEITTPYVELNVQHAWHLYVIQLELDRLRIDRNRFIKELNQAGIGTSVHYLPLHMHPYYRDAFGYKPDDLPVARSAYDRILSLPVYPRLGDEEVQYVIDNVKRIAVENGRAGSAQGDHRVGEVPAQREEPPEGSQDRDAAAWVKRSFDFSVALLALLLLSPLLLLVALLIKLTSPGPVFFAQERVGRGFRRFKILKFRTMVPDAPRRGGQLTAGRDPRITPIGHVLRKTKLDELPQLVNVVKGDMSFVGPRPEVPRFVEMFRQDFEELLRVRPGITDLASIKYRHESEILGDSPDPEATYLREILPEKILLAKEYVSRASLWFDLRLIFATLLRLTT
jgi:perosamine synthetase